MRKLINIGIDVMAALLIIGIISFFLVGGPKGGNPEVTTTAETTVATTEPTTAATTETTTVTTTELVEETTTKVVEKTTKKEIVTATVKPNAREKSKNKYSEKEIYLLAQILEAEAGGEGRAEMARVGTVVLNRVDSNIRDFRSVNTIYEVLSQPGQYTTTFRRIQAGLVPSKAAIEVARGLINGSIEPDVPEAEGILWQCQDYPDWNARVVYKHQLQNGRYHYYAVYDPS